MPRSTSPTLEGLLTHCEVQSTVYLKLRSDDEFWFATTDNLTISSQLYTNKLKRVGEFKQSGSSALDRIQIVISNSDKEWGIKTASDARLLELGDALVKRFYAKDGDRSIFEHKHIFGGKMIFSEATEEVVTIDIVPDTTAAGVCLATRTLSPTCAWVYKDANCQSLSTDISCNKNLRSRSGCAGKNNTEHFGGWACPENPTNSAPGSGGNDGGGLGGGGYTPPSCFLAGTPIWTPRGEQPIEILKPGWNHFSFNEQTGHVEVDVIDRIFWHAVTEYLELHFDDGGFIPVTGEHPFWHEGYYWLRADSIPLGESVWRRFGRQWRKSKLKSFVTVKGGPFDVYNFRSTKNPTYFANGYGVHNTKIEPPYDPYQA